jgi:hypothetical protein
MSGKLDLFVRGLQVGSADIRPLDILRDSLLDLLSLEPPIPWILG